MTKDVLISVKGLQLLGDDDMAEPVEVVTAGKYYYRNGNHYVRYDEVQEGFREVTVNYIRANETSMEVRKKGLTNVHMVFEETRKNVTYYQTPFGSIQMGIAATSVRLRESENRIDIHVDYALEINSEHFADCYIQINIQPRAGGTLHLG